MSNNVISEDITIEENEDEDIKKVNSFSDAINSLGELGFKKYEKKTSNLSFINVKGIIRVRCLNEWKEKNYGYRHACLDELIEELPRYRMSVSGFGITKLIELIKGIQASFEQNDLPERLRDRLR